MGTKSRHHEKRTGSILFLAFASLIYFLLSVEVGSWIASFTNDSFSAYTLSFGIVALSISLSLHFLLKDEMLSFEIRMFQFLSKRGLIEIEAITDEAERKTHQIAQKS